MNYLGVGYGGTGYAVTRGFNGDLFSGFNLVTAGAGANNQSSRDIISILDPRAKPILGYYVMNVFIGNAAIRLDSVGAGSRVILMGFGFEAINTEATREAVMQRVIGFLDGSIVVNVDDNGTNRFLPSHVTLEQNYPNPFNPSTTIRYELPKQVLVSLKVYNVLGQEVASLVSEVQIAGKHQVEFHGENLSSGVYFYRLQAGEFVDTKKLVLLK